MIDKSSTVIAQLEYNLAKLGLNSGPGLKEPSELEEPKPNQSGLSPYEGKSTGKNLCTIETWRGDATAPVVLGGRAFDIVFIDPPFAMQLHRAAVSALLAARALRPSALVYIESARRDAAPPVPDCWQQWRTKTAGDVVASVYRTPGANYN